MTAPARITQMEMLRAVNAAKKAGGAGARVIIDLANRKLEIVLSADAIADFEDNPWEQDGAAH